MSKYQFSPVVTADEVISLAKLMLRWPYDVIRKISAVACEEVPGGEARFTLQPFVFKNLFYEEGRGFFIGLEQAPFPSADKFEDYRALFPDIFFLKCEVEAVEAQKPEYPFTPAGYSSQKNMDLCTDKNIASLVPRLLYALCNFWEGTKLGEVEFPSEEEMKAWGQELNVAPLLRDQPRQVINDCLPTKEQLEKAREFVRFAKTLGQENDYILARMLRLRWSKISNSQLGELLPANPGSVVGGKAHIQRGWRLLHEQKQFDALFPVDVAADVEAIRH